VNCSVDVIEEQSRSLNTGMEIFPVSCKTSEGLDAWSAWLIKHVGEKRGAC